MENPKTLPMMQHARSTCSWLLALLLAFMVPPLAAQTCGGGNATTDYINGTIGGDAVAMHWATGLVWKRCRHGAFYSTSGQSCTFVPGTPMTRTWNNWMSEFAPAPFAAGSNWGVPPGQPNRLVTGEWRMPYRQELISLTQGCTNSPKINGTIFPNTPASGFWSGSPYPPDFGYAWEVSFADGSSAGIPRTYADSVRLVRGGTRFANLAGPFEKTWSPNTQYVFPSFTLVSAGGGGATSWGGLRISGAGNPRVQINGAGTWVSEAVVKSGDSIAVRMTSGNGGTLQTATLTLRSASVAGTNATASNGGNEPWEYEVTTATFRLSAERICRVAANGNAANDGASWASPMSLQAALDDDDPACDQVWVKKGVYVPGAIAEASFTINRKVRIYGGFAGTETAVSQRNVTYNKSVLSGDIGGDDVRDANGITLSTEDIRGVNSYHVLLFGDTVNGAFITRETVLDGLVITGGDARGPAFTYFAYGGGVLCRARYNTDRCSPTLNSMEFRGNRAFLSGGGMFMEADDGAEASPKLVRNTFSSNAAGDSGGGMEFHTNDGQVEAEVEQTAFVSNAATGSGGAAQLWVLGDSPTAQVQIVDSIFVGNHAGFSGGALYSYVGAGGSLTLDVSRSTFAGNQAHWGGAVYSLVDGQSVLRPTLRNSTFDGNMATQYGGAIYNRAEDNGSRIVPLMQHVTLTENTAKTGGAIFDGSGSSGQILRGIINSLFWGNSATDAGNQIHQEGTGSALAINYSILQGGVSGISGNNAGSFASGIGNLDQDPLLAPLAPNGGIGQTRMPAVSSPAVDAAADEEAYCPATDQRGVTRPQGAGCDIGAVEQKSGEGHLIDDMFSDGFES